MSNGIAGLWKDIRSKADDPSLGYIGASMLPGIGEATDIVEIGAGAQDFARGDKSDAVRRMLLGIAGLALPFATGATIKKLTPRIKSARSPRWPTQPPTKEDFGYRWAKGEPERYENIHAYMNAVDMSGDPILKDMLKADAASDAARAARAERLAEKYPAFSRDEYRDAIRFELQSTDQAQELGGLVDADPLEFMERGGLAAHSAQDSLELLNDLENLGIKNLPLELVVNLDGQERRIIRTIMKEDPNALEVVQQYIGGLEDELRDLYADAPLNFMLDEQRVEGIRGVRNPKDYASYDDYMGAVEMDLENLNIPPEGFGGNLMYNVDTGDYYYDFNEEGGFRPPGYDPDDPFFGDMVDDEVLAEVDIPDDPFFGDVDIPDDPPFTGWDDILPPEPPSRESYEDIAEWLRDKSIREGRYFGGKKRFDFNDDLPF